MLHTDQCCRHATREVVSVLCEHCEALESRVGSGGNACSLASYFQHPHANETGQRTGTSIPRFATSSHRKPQRNWSMSISNRKLVQDIEDDTDELKMGQIE